MNANKLMCALYNSCSAETSYSSSKKDWSIKNKTLGQCAVTALIVNDHFGGDIKKCIINDSAHYFNEVEEKTLDFTREQFSASIRYENTKIKTREEILSNADTKKRYELLSSRVKKFILDLDKIDNDIQKCRKCALLVENFTNSTCVSYGTNTDIVILGEAPANNGWRKSGKAWHDVNNKILQSGKILNLLLNTIGLELEDTMFLEAIKCFPKNRKDLKTCNANCKEYLLEQLKLLNPKVVITLGDSATKSILHIKYSKFSDIVGNINVINIGDREIKILPIYHPSPISPVGYKGNVPIFDKLKEDGIL